MPIKANILAWCIGLDRFPMRINLERKGIDLESTGCPCCDGLLESVNHVFFSCVIASQL